MRHPGTFNANPLSAAAGITTLQIVADGTPNRKANESARLLRKKVNNLFAEHGFDWVCYGDFSGFKLLPHYEGPAPTSDDFIPCNGALDQLDGQTSGALVHAFRRGMLLHGVDLPGLAGMTTAAHSEADIDRAAQAIAATVAMLKEEKIS
jgi:glutamate-1-semialdehyde 2,1-aminomutase